MGKLVDYIELINKEYKPIESFLKIVVKGETLRGVNIGMAINASENLSHIVNSDVGSDFNKEDIPAKEMIDNNVMCFLLSFTMLIKSLELKLKEIPEETTVIH